ncbi:MAG: glycosyl hydrolase-related protein [Sulfolobales archaeon]
MIKIFNPYKYPIYLEINGTSSRAEHGVSYHLAKTFDGYVRIESELGEVFEKKVDLPRPRRFKIYLTPTMHTDLGYTDTQDRVIEIHRDNIRRILKSVREKNSKYVLEVIWQIQDEIDSVLEYNREGLIGVQAFPLNILTGLLNHEEIIRIFYKYRDLKRRGFKISVAALNDIPTAVWIIPSILSSSGINYYVQAVNPDRAPLYFINRDLASPFYWVGPDGSRVLAWFSGFYKGPMSGFHGYHQGKWSGLLHDVQTALAGVALFLWYYESRGYPLERILMYGVFWENEIYSDKYIRLVDKLNEILENPMIIIATTDEFFRDLEEEIREKGLSIPEVRGSFGSYWEDGAASTARELALYREIKRLLYFIETAYTLDYMRGGQYPYDKLSDIVDNLILFSEHTWGAWNSVSEPYNPSVIYQWEYKLRFLTRALELARELSVGEYLSNPYPYSIESFVNYSHIKIPPMSSVLIPSKSLKSVNSSTKRVETDHYEIVLEKGFLSEIIDKDLGKVISDTSEYYFGEVLYVLGGAGSSVERTIFDFKYEREPSKPYLRVYREISSRLAYIGENDDLVVLKIISEGQDLFIEKELLIGKRRKEISMNYKIYKPERFEKEALYIVFPFRDSNDILLEEPGVFTSLKRDYVRGGCRVWYTINSTAILKSHNYDAALYSHDAPLITVGDIFRGEWDPLITDTGRIFSYTINNYWHTNYKASQGGEFVFRYKITSSREIKPSKALSFFSSPLIGRGLTGDLSIYPLEYHITTFKKWDLGDGVVLRLLEVDGESKNIVVKSESLKGYRVYIASVLEEPLERLGVFSGEIELKLQPKRYTTLVFEKS